MAETVPRPVEGAARAPELTGGRLSLGVAALTPTGVLVVGYAWLASGSIVPSLSLPFAVGLPFAVAVAHAALGRSVAPLGQSVRLASLVLALVVGGGLLLLGPWQACGPVAPLVRLVVSLVAALVAGAGYLVATSTAGAGMQSGGWTARVALLVGSLAASTFTIYALLFLYVGFVSVALACHP